MPNEVASISDAAFTSEAATGYCREPWTETKAGSVHTHFTVWRFAHNGPPPTASTWLRRARVSPETEGVFFREGEAPTEPQRDGSATMISTRSPAGADPRDPGEQSRPAGSACGSAGASPSHLRRPFTPPMRPFRGRVSGQALGDSTSCLRVFVPSCLCGVLFQPQSHQGTKSGRARLRAGS